jgi:hypothetical protein
MTNTVSFTLCGLPMMLPSLPIIATYDPLAAGLDLAWAANPGAPCPMTPEQAGALCELITSWNVTGPVVSDDNVILVRAGEPVPLEPEVVRYLPPWLVAPIARAAMSDAQSRREG